MARNPFLQISRRLGVRCIIHKTRPPQDKRLAEGPAKVTKTLPRLSLHGFKTPPTEETNQHAPRRRPSEDARTASPIT